MSDNKHVVKLETRSEVKINKWKVSEGTIVYDGRVLFLYESDGRPGKLKSKVVGTVSKLLVKEGDSVKPGDCLLEIAEGCSHPTVINDLCAECGADLQKDGAIPSQATIPMVHSIPQLKVSHEQAQRIGKADTDRLLKEKKLVLLVDLDQTLIHTTHDNIPNNLKDIHHFQLFGSHNPWYHTRLRPGTERFLQNMKNLYELHICTFGVRPYAHMVAHILDKDASLFSNRILSRDECFDFNSKHANLQALFPCGDELVCIIDDREDVWNYSPNLIPVKPYHFFKHTGDIHDPNLSPAIKNQNCVAKDFLVPGVKVKEKKSDIEKGSEEKTEVAEIDVEEEDDYLLDLEVVLKKVHNTFYNVYNKEMEGEAHVKWVIHHLRSEVLKGCELVFSGLVPLRVELEDSEPYLLATKLGATIAKEVGENTTHLVAAAKGTAKVHQAKKLRHVKIVNPNWLATCGYRWEHVDERLFEVGTGGPHPFGKTPKEMQPEMIALSKEDMDAMNEEVGDLDSDTDTDTDEERKAKRRKVLDGCELVFSRLVPHRHPLRESRPFVLARKMGAKVRLHVTDSTTHLVSAATGTVKMRAALRKSHIKIVNPHWLTFCYERAEKLEEVYFKVGEGGPVPFGKPNSGKKRLRSSYHHERKKRKGTTTQLGNMSLGESMINSQGMMEQAL